jgi:hypothetical protein
MKHLSLGIIFAALLAFVVVSCRQGDKGDPGPSGTVGLLPYSNGSITGTLTGTSQLSDENFTQSLNFKYFKSASDNVHTIIDNDGDYDSYIVTRYDSLGDSYIKFEFTVDSTLNQDGITYTPYIYNPYVTIVFNKKLANSNSFYFATCDSPNNPFDVESVQLSTLSSGGNSNITFDNLSINHNTGLLSFDYSLEIDYYSNSSANYAYMDGTVNINTYNVAYREASK